jgi:hypothetical protein
MEAKCDQCGRTYHPHEGPAHFKRYRYHFCSIPCRAEWNASGANPANGTRPVANCVVCGTAFSYKPRSSGVPARVCSRECLPAFLSKAKSRSVEVACSHCQTVFMVRKVILDARDRFFCSKVCANLGHRGVLSGKRNGRYVHGKSAKGYPAEFNWYLKDKIRRRDGGCVVCKIPADVYRAQAGHKLPVHHIDCDKTNNVTTNLVSVCKKCHGSMHGGPALRREWAEKFRSYIRSLSPESSR